MAVALGLMMLITINLLSAAQVIYQRFFISV
jgi:hypothetical protein